MERPRKPIWKLVLAAIGVIYLMLFAGYLVFAAVEKSKPRGPSELEAHPERANEIMARQRAEEFQERLGLSDEQTQQIADILKAEREHPLQEGRDPRERWRATQERIGQVLTPEQQAKMEQERGPQAGPRRPERPEGVGPEQPPDGQAPPTPPEGGTPPGPEGAGEARNARGPGGPRGPMGGMSEERMDSLREKMTPEQQQRFDKKVKEWQERQREWQNRGPGGGNRPQGPPPE
ncbi:MAG TPA: hypothetical protein PLO37_05945 [Candidatus Hydrogenedentes bacterium]|nr:hypothetical protein [Candidatus Hydrogenedentota bacterium]HPG66371.1 hypothetical protein [Candidatus Hydrogenedentota bacterium]